MTNLIRTLGVMIALCFLVTAQEGTPVALTEGPYPGPDYQRLFFYSGSNLTYMCAARSVQGQNSSTAVSAITAANPGVFTSTGHGFDLGTAPRVTVSGGTGDWAEVNSTWILSPIDANTFTLRDPTTGAQLDMSGNTGGIGTVVVRTTAPKTGSPVWAIRKYTYDGSNNLIGAFTAFSGNGQKMTNRCSDRAATFTEWR